MLTVSSNIFLALAGLVLSACSPAAPPAPEGSLFVAEARPPLHLPDRLQEISGLAVSPDGRLFGHDDEIGVIYEISVADGTIVKWFVVGETIVTGDFEGLTITPAGEFWLTTSTGKLYRFREGADRAHVGYDRADAGLERDCEVEGVAYLAASESLILACKQNYGRRMEDRPALRIWPTSGGPAADWGESAAQYAAAAHARRFAPSDLTIDPVTGRLLLLSARAAAWVELSSDGTPIAGRALGSVHRQAEGAAVLPDGSLVIADEGGNDQALLSRYSRVQ